MSPAKNWTEPDEASKHAWAAQSPYRHLKTYTAVQALDRSSTNTQARDTLRNVLQSTTWQGYAQAMRKRKSRT